MLQLPIWRWLRLQVKKNLHFGLTTLADRTKTINRSFWESLGENESSIDLMNSNDLIFKETGCASRPDNSIGTTLIKTTPRHHKKIGQKSK